jgi:hypothetical protein
MTRLHFYTSVTEVLSSECIREKIEALAINGQKENVFGVKALPEKLERQCAVCSTRQQRKRSRTICVNCGKGLHPKCVGKHVCKK